MCSWGRGGAVSECGCGLIECRRARGELVECETCGGTGIIVGYCCSDPQCSTMDKCEKCDGRGEVLRAPAEPPKGE